ncbi:ATP-binding cassette, subfamily B, bacterial [Lachnospiraceae bacterium 3_1_57FAA_CT1]|nr:ATP-binding cassette, subfamily B, bacterial [Lachnospiraceae bacterium 3_1_57FAA_CT1]
MKKLSSYLMEHKFGYLLGFVSMVIAVSLDMVSPQLTKHIIDDVIVGGRIEILKYLLGGILIVGAGRCVFGYTKEFTFDRIGSSIATDMRKDLFSHIQSLSADYFDKTNTGELMSRVKDDIDRIWNAVSYVSMLILEVVFHTGIVLFCMYRLNWKLALIPTAAMLITGTIAILEERRLGVIYEDISEENAVLNTVAEENLAGVRTVKAFAREKFEIGKFLSHNNRYYELNMRQSKVFVKYYPYFSLITKLLPLIILFFGGGLVIQGKLSIGSLSAFVEYSMNIVWPMEMLGWLSNDFSSAVGSYRKIRKIYNVKPSISEPEVPEILPAVKGKVEFRNVSFHKEDGYEILHDISFCVQPGNTIGIMGATGAGKTSIIQLLQRLYDATDGNVYVDDVDIRNLSLKQLRSNISLVMQDVFLFSDTISENVKLGKRGMVDASTIRGASACAQASEFIEKLDEQYETVIGERGVGLSGGQKQRISIARAIAKKNPILVLDDSTSALDMETEYAIQQALLELTDTTKLIIAHRISAVRNADEIIVLENGSIKERGTHESLLSQKGLYYETWQAQYGVLGTGQERKEA